MAVIRTATVTSNAQLVRALVERCMDEDRGVDMFVTNADDGIKFSNWEGTRSAVVIGHPISVDCVRITWKELDRDGARAWDEDITTHSCESLFGVSEALTRFVCDAEWPNFLTRHRKSYPRVTEFFDDKPYGTVDVVIQISSSLESLDLYRTFTEQKMKYVQDMGGYLHTIGHINDRPVAITPMIHQVGGVNVLYVEAQSALVDWEMIEDWVKRVVPEGTPMCNSPINALGYIRNAQRKKEESTNV